MLSERKIIQFKFSADRTCLADCQIALRLKPSYEKALVRAAQCYYILEKYEEAIKFCDDVLKNGLKNETVNKIKSDSLYKKVSTNPLYIYIVFER